MQKKKAKILMVDDEPSNLLALEAVLEELDEELVRAGSGKDALRWLMRDEFALIILDVQMPGMDGFETAALVRENDRCSHTPIMFLTAVGKSQKEVFQGYEVGAVDYLTKPFVPEILRYKVQVLVDLYRKNQEVQALNQRLTLQAKELEQAVDDLEAFAYSVSHDLRAPLRRMAGFSDIMLEEDEGKLDHESLMYLKMISTNSRRMGQLVDDLLIFSRMGNKPLEKSRLETQELVHQAVREVQVQEVIGHQPKVQVQSLLPAMGDPSLVRQVFVNLVSNAFKYTRRKEQPVVEIKSFAEGRDIVYRVSDNGEGFDMKYAGKLFSVFQRLHRQEDFEGSGIGLALVHRIVQRHGGRVWAEGKPGEGASFYFTLEKP